MVRLPLAPVPDVRVLICDPPLITTFCATMVTSPPPVVLIVLMVRPVMVTVPAVSSSEVPAVSMSPSTLSVLPPFTAILPRTPPLKVMPVSEDWVRLEVLISTLSSLL